MRIALYKPKKHAKCFVNTIFGNMKNWQTHIEDFQLPKVNPEDILIFLGSCFAENIGIKLKKLLPHNLVNPLGIVYNPASILSILQRCRDQAKVVKEELVENDKLFHHPDFHGIFSHFESQQTLKIINTGLEILSEQLSNAKIIYLSLGTAFVFLRKSDQKIVNNCHKLPAAKFIRKLLSYSETKDLLNQITQSILSLNSNVKIVFTISPVRHIRDGLIENSHSKAILMSATKELINQNNSLHYFPAFELMLDELRDYRYFGDDMIHPSSAAINYIFEIFLEKSFTKKDIQTLHRIEKIHQFISHRPIHNQMKKQNSGIQKTLQRLVDIQNGNPKIDLDHLKKKLENLKR
jgi:hypothetical protein